MYRFEKGDLATGYIYDAIATDAKRWLDETNTLNSALNSLQGAALLICACTLAALAF